VNKNDLVQKLAERTGLSKMDAQKAVDGVFDVVVCNEDVIRRKPHPEGLFKAALVAAIPSPL